MLTRVFLKFENRDIKITRVNTIFITKYVNLKLFIYFNFVRCWGPLWSNAIFRASTFIEKSMSIHNTQKILTIKIVKALEHFAKIIWYHIAEQTLLCLAATLWLVQWQLWTPSNLLMNSIESPCKSFWSTEFTDEYAVFINIDLLVLVWEPKKANLILVFFNASPVTPRSTRMQCARPGDYHSLGPTLDQYHPPKVTPHMH